MIRASAILCLLLACKPPATSGATDVQITGSSISFYYPESPFVLTRRVPVSPHYPTITNGDISEYEVNPSLPAGLTFSAFTGELAGTPTERSAETVYVVTGKKGSTTGRTEIRVRVLEAAPNLVTYTTPIASYPKDMPIAANVPSLQGGAPDAFSISPSLPPGLALDDKTGVITGIPTATIGATPFVVTATNEGGSSSFTLYISVTQPPSTLQYQVNNAVYAVGVAITTNSPLGANGASDFSANPALPNGLFLDPTTGDITGTPTGLSPLTTYAITASNSAGQATAMINITVKNPCSAQCAPKVQGFSGPVAIAVGATPPAACPGNYPTQTLTAFDTLQNPSTHTCGCGCTADCEMTRADYQSTGCTGTIDSQEVLHPSDLATCHAWTFAATANSTGLANLHDICTGTSENFVMPAASWGTNARACQAPELDEACTAVANAACLPVPGGGYPAQLCIYADGDVPCPGTYGNRTTLYRGADDTRHCDSCVCTPQNTCTLTQVTAYYASASCSGAASSTLSSPFCFNRPYAGAVDLSVNQLVIGTQPSCSATSAKSGQLSPKDLVTICCQ